MQLEIIGRSGELRIQRDRTLSPLQYRHQFLTGMFLHGQFIRVHIKARNVNVLKCYFSTATVVQKHPTPFTGEEPIIALWGPRRLANPEAC